MTTTLSHVEQTLLWTPKSKTRPQFRRMHDGRVITYTATRTLDAQLALAAQWQHDPVEGPITVYLYLTDTDVRVSITPCEAHVNRKLRADIDNYEKLILDALNNVAFVDDSQIVSLHAVKL